MHGTDEHREQKGIMRQKAGMRLWTLILALALVASGTAISPRTTWADGIAGEPAPPNPDTGAGDPDWPDSPSAKSPKTTPPRGAGGPAVHQNTSVRASWAAKWVWSFRTAFSSVYRIFFRV